MISGRQTYRIPDVFILFVILLILCTVFVISEIENGIISGKYFWFYVSMTLLSIVAIPVAIIKRGERLNFKLPDLLILLFSVSAVFVTLNHTGRLTNKCLLLIFATMFYYYLRIFLAGKSKLIYILCSLAFVTIGLAEAVWGLIQLYGFTYSQHGLFKTTGSFFNPGPYSGWLAMVFPMALGYARFNYFNNKGCKVTKSSPDGVYRSPLISRHSSFISLNSSLLVLSSLTVLCIIMILPAAMSRASCWQPQ
jgi:hypothetical protein